MSVENSLRDEKSGHNIDMGDAKSSGLGVLSRGFTSIAKSEE